MAGNSDIPDLNRTELRQFGLTTGIAIVVIFGGVFPWLLDVAWPLWPWLLATPLWLLAAAQPLWLRPIYRGWMRFGLLASRVMTPLILGIVFFAMISPMAWARRLLGKDAMNRTLDPASKSYRVESSKSPREKLERPF